MKHTFSTIVLSVCLLSSFGQVTPKIRISATVLDEKSLPLPGVSVRIKGTNQGTVTDANGKFGLPVTSKETVLSFSMVGFKTIEKKAGDITNGIVVMESAEASSLNEVVVIGYGQVKKPDLTGSVGIVNVKEMQKAPVPSFDGALAGRIAGVNVVSGDGQPGAGSTITIRGSSVSQDASPLYVIDGFPIENMDFNSIDPQDIETLNVLKDASSIAIYGARGANGVILITTKRGKAGPVKVNYNYSTGFQQVTKTLKMMNPYDFVKLQLDLDSLASTPSSKSTKYTDIYLGPINSVTGKRPMTLDDYRNVQGYNWQQLLLRRGRTETHSLNISGGNVDTRYAVSGSSYNQKGIILNTGLTRYEGRFTLDQNIKKNVKLGLNASYASSKNYGTVPAATNAGNGGGVVQGMWQYRPVSGVGNQDLINSALDSAATSDILNGTSTTTIDVINPLVQAQNEYRTTTNNTGYINAFINYNFLKYFNLRLTGGYTGTQVKGDAFYNSNTQQGNIVKNANGAQSNVNGINGAIAYANNTSYSSINYLTYRNEIAKHQILDALIGFDYQYAQTRGYSFKSINIPQASEYLGIYSLGTGTASSPVYTGSQWQQYSTYFRANYFIEDKYLFTLTGRADGSSRFAPGHQWGYFPSGAFAWNFTKEKFMQKVSNTISSGKIRLSYGSIGNNKVGDFSYLSQYGSLTNGQGYPLGGVNTGGIVPFFYGNDNLTWETKTEFDLGLEMGFLNDRISLETDYYTSKTKNFLLGVTLPALAGYINGANSQYQNTGVVGNDGLEFTLNTVNIRAKNFSWLSNFNISFQKNRIIKFYDGVEEKYTSWGLAGSANAWVAKVGGPITQFYGYQWGGVYQYTDFNKLANGTYVLKPGIPTYSANVQPGDPKYVDLNGDGIVDSNDQSTLGSALPLYTGGFSNTFQYKNFDLSIFAQFSYGNKILNANKVVFESTGGYFAFGNQFADYANRWTPTNPTNDIPRARYNTKGDAQSTNPKPSSWDIEDGSFLRLKTISLGYNLPKKILQRLSISGIRVYASAQNIWTWTKYSGIDPEVSTYRTANSANSPTGFVSGAVPGGSGYTFIQPSSGYSALAGGYDYTPYPRAITIVFGANISF